MHAMSQYNDCCRKSFVCLPGRGKSFSEALILTNPQYDQGSNWRVGNCPPRFWQNRRQQRSATILLAHPAFGTHLRPWWQKIVHSITMQNCKLSTCCVHELFWMSEQKKKKKKLCTQHSALHVIRLRYGKAGGSGNPLSLIPALRNISIFLHKQAKQQTIMTQLAIFISRVHNSKMPMLQRAGMREGGLPITPAFQFRFGHSIFTSFKIGRS